MVQEARKFKQFIVWLFTGKRLPLTDSCRLRCPRCRTLMDKVHKEHVVIDVCNQCHGMWLDDGEIDKLSNMAASQFKKGE